MNFNILITILILLLIGIQILMGIGFFILWYLNRDTSFNPSDIITPPEDLTPNIINSSDVDDARISTLENLTNRIYISSSIDSSDVSLVKPYPFSLAPDYVISGINSMTKIDDNLKLNINDIYSGKNKLLLSRIDIYARSIYTGDEKNVTGIYDGAGVLEIKFPGKSEKIKAVFFPQSYSLQQLYLSNPILITDLEFILKMNKINIQSIILYEFTN